MEPQQTRRFGSIPSATGGIARLACDRLRAAGKDLSTLLAAAGLTLEDIDDKTRRIEVSAQIKVLELAARELGDEYLGFRLATEFELGEIGLLYYVAASSERLAEALHDAERYSTIMNDGVRLRLSLQGATEIALSYENVDRQSDRHQIEFWLVALICICRAVTGNRLAPRLVKLQHSRPGTPPEFRAFLGCDVEFAADADVIQFPLSYSSLPIVGADSHLHKLLLNYADEALGRTSTQRDTARSRVRGSGYEVAAAWQGQRVGNRASPRHEPALVVACIVRRGHDLFGDSRSIAGCARRTLHQGGRAPDLAGRLAIGLRRDQFVHACVRPLDRGAAQSIPKPGRRSDR